MQPAGAQRRELAGAPLFKMGLARGAGADDSERVALRRGMTTEIEPGEDWQLVLSGALAYVACEAPALSPAHPFAPASVGDEWVYTHAQAHAAGQVATTESVERIVSVTRDGDRLVARVRSEYVGASSERDLVITPLGVTPEIGTMMSSAGEVRARAVEGVYLPRELTPGVQWEWRQELETPASSMSVVGRCEVVGLASFEGRSAVRVRCETRIRMTATAASEHVQVEDNDYVRGIGLVRSVTTAAAGYRAEKSLIRRRVAGSR